MKSITWTCHEGPQDIQPRGDSDFDKLSSIDCLVYVKGKPWGVCMGRYNFALQEWFLTGVGGSVSPREETVYFAPINYPE